MADRFERAVAAIDAANAADPHQVVVDGVARPKELVHAEVVTRWLRLLDPDADELQLLAARAHHLRRWVVPRQDYPEGRAGYLRWRADQKRRQADEAAAILAAEGYGSDEVDRVAAIIAKRDLRTDASVQTHEDALCLSFLELQLDELTEQLGHDHMVDVARKTIAKMSDRGIEAAATLDLSAQGSAVVRAALASPPVEAS